jgi:PD-(D/E)XK nuclease superfamily
MVDHENIESDPQTYAILGACMAIHGELGPGFLEPVYQEALAIEFAKQSSYDSVILELKALSDLNPKHFAQVINYLKATRLERGLLVNFGASRLEYKRVAFTHNIKNSSTD